MRMKMVCDDRTLRDVANEFLALKKAQKVRERTLSDYKKYIDKFLGHLQMKMNATISRTVIEEAVILFYEAAGFWSDVLEAEVRSMSDQKLTEVYLAL